MENWKFLITDGKKLSSFQDNVLNLDKDIRISTRLAEHFENRVYTFCDFYLSTCCLLACNDNKSSQKNRMQFW